MKTVIEMAREAGFHVGDQFVAGASESELERFAELVRDDAIATEREACAKVCEETEKIKRWDDYVDGCQDCASAIRARGQA